MRLLRITALLALLLPSLASAFDPDVYPPGELARAASDLTSTPGALTIHIDAAQAKCRSTVIFSGRVRPLGDDLRDLIRLWAKALGHPQAHIDLFESELEVTQGSQHYRMPVQRTLADPFLQEVPPNGQVTVYVLLLGGIDRMPVFVINAFEATPPVSASEPDRSGKSDPR